MRNISSPDFATIFPGTVNRITTASSEAARIARENQREDNRLKQLIKKSLTPPRQDAIMPGTINSTYDLATGNLSGIKKDLAESAILAQKAVAAGKIPPAAGQGRHLDVII